MPATRKDVEESTMGGRGGECEAGGRRDAAGPAAAASAYPVADGEERGTTSLPTIDSTVHTIFRSPSMGAWVPDSESGSGGVQQSRYSLLPHTAATAATASIQQMESAAAMMKLAYRNRLQDRHLWGTERRNRTPGGDVTGVNEGGPSWRLPAAAWAAQGAAAVAGAAGAEAPAPLRGEPELPRPHLLRLNLPLADVCEASVARQRAPRDPSTSSDEGLGLDRQPSLTDLRSLDSESDGLAAAMPPLAGRHRPRGLHEAPFSGHRIHQSQSPPHDRFDSLRSGRPMSASTTFHGLQSMPGYTGRKGAGNEDGAEGLPPTDGQHDPAGMAPPVDYTMWANKIVELQQMSDSLTQGIANFMRIASSSNTQYHNPVPPLNTNERRGFIENHFSRKTLDSSSPMVSSRTLFSRSGPAIDTERHCTTTNAGRDNCIVPCLNCTVTPADSAVSADRYKVANSFEIGMVTRSLASPQSGSYLYQDQGSIRGTPRVGVGVATVDGPVTVATVPSLRGVGLDQNEALKRQSAEVSGDNGGYRPGVVPHTRRQCTGESGDFEPPETTSSVEMSHCSRNCICKEDCQYTARTTTDVYPNDLPTLTLFERADDAETCTDSAVGVNLCETEEIISADIRIHESSTTNESPDGSIGWMRSVRSETAICSHRSDFVVPDTGLNYTFPPTISGIDEMRAILLKEKNVNTGESLANDKCHPQCNERNGDVEKPVANAGESKHKEGEQNLNSSNRNVNGDTSSEPSYDLDQHFLPTTATSSEVCETENDRGEPKIINYAENERNEHESTSVTSNMRNNDTVENLKKEHISHSLTGTNKPSTSNVFKMVTEERAMQNICISTCALRTLLSGHGILEEVKEMDKLSTTILETKERAAHLNTVRESPSENEVQSRTTENGRHDTPNRETCRTAERPAVDNDIYAVSGPILGVKPGASRTGSVADAGLFGKSITVLASEKELATSEEEYNGCAGDDTASNATSASTSLFGGVIHRPGTAASPSETSSGLELVAPTNSVEDVPTLMSRRPASRYDARETLNLVRDLIWKDSTYKTLRPEHDVEAPSTTSCQQGVEKERKRAPAAAAEPQQRANVLSGVRTVWQNRHRRLRHDRSSQTCVAVQEFPNIPATDSLQRTVKTTNLKGPPRSSAVSPRAATSPIAARLHQKTSPAPIRSGPTVPGGWPAVSARPLVRQAAHAQSHAQVHAHAGQSRSAGSSPRLPCSAYSREPATRGSSASASPRDVAAARSRDACAADALLADAASLFRAKLEAADRKQAEQRRPQKGRALSAAARLSSAASAGPPSYMRMLRPGASSGRRPPLQDQDNWHQRQQQLQHQQLQLQQRQQQLQQRQLQLQQRQQMQQRQQLLQRQQRVQQTPTWQPRINHAQIAKPVTRRPPARTGDAAGCSRTSVPGPGSASLRMLQARLRAGGSMHHGVVAVAEADEQGKPGAEPSATDCPTRDETDVCREPSEPSEPAQPEPVQPPQPEEEPTTPEEQSHGTPEADDADSSTDTTELCRELLDTQDDNSSGVGTNSDISSLLNADFVNIETRLSDFSLLSERCGPTMRFVNYLPSAPIRKIEEDDLFREIMLSAQGDVFRSSYDSSPLPHCGNETQQSDFIKPPDRADSDTVLSVQSDHIIEPPVEFCTDVKAGGEDQCVLSSQSPRDDTRNHGSCPIASTPAVDGLEISHTDDEGMKASCSRCSSSSSIHTHGETGTSRNAAMTSDLDEFAETTEIMSVSGTNRDSSVEDNAILTHSTGISNRKSPSILHSERTLDNHSERQNNVSDGKSVHEDDPMIFFCNLGSVQTTQLALDETNTACGFAAEKCSPQLKDFREKCGNDITNTASAGTGGSAGRNAQDIVCSMLPVEATFLSTADKKEDHGSAGDSYIEHQVMDQERVNYNEKNEAGRNHDQNNLNTLAKPSSSELPITSSVEIICAEITANNDVTHKPSIQENTDVELNEIPTEQNEGDKKASGSSQCDSLSPTVSSEFTDCSHTSDKSAEGPTEGRGLQKDSKTNTYNIVQSTSANLHEEQSLSTILSQESSPPLWNTSTDNDSSISRSVEVKTTVQEECSEIIPCAVDVCGPKTAPSVMQDVLIDIPQTEKCLTDVSMINVVDKISDTEENNCNIDTASLNLQDDDSFCDAVDDTTSLKALSDTSSISDPFIAAQFYSDGDEGPLSSVIGSTTSCQISDEMSFNYVDECLSNLCETLDRSRVESELQENFNEELNKTDVDNNASSETNGEIISMGTDTTSYAIASTAPVPETSSTEAHGARRTHIVDDVPSVTSWVTVSTVSFSELPVEEASMESLRVRKRYKVESSQGGSSDNPECIASESRSIASSELPVGKSVSSFVTTGANFTVENNAEQVESFFDTTECIGDVTLDEICAIHSCELTDEESLLCLAVAGTQSNVEIKEHHMVGFSDNVSLPESFVTSSSELLVDTMTSYFSLVGAQTILEHAECSSDNAERIRNASADETCTLRSSECEDEANISCLVVNGTQNKVELKEHVESSADNVQTVLNTEKRESKITDSSELVAEEITSSIEVVGGQNIFEHVETSSDNAVCTLDLKEDKIHSSELAVERKIRPPVVDGTQTMVQINEEHVDSSSGIAERSQYTAAHESYMTTSSELQIEGNISSLASVGDQTKLDNILEHVESSLDDAERILHPTACERDTSESGAKSENIEDESCAVVSNEEISDEIPLGEASASWDTLSDNSWLTDEDEDLADNTRESEATTQLPQRRRRHRRQPQWRAARAERDPESERRIYDLVLASPEVEVHLSEALSHSEAELPLTTPAPRLAAVGAVGSSDTEALVAAALAGVAMVDAEAETEADTDILYGTRDLHSAAVEAAVACIVDSELRDLSALYVQRLGGCLLVGGGGGQPDPQPTASTQTLTQPEEETRSTMDEDSSYPTLTLSRSTTAPASPLSPDTTRSDCSLQAGSLALAGDTPAECPLDAPRTHAIATLLTVCVFLAAYSSCLLLDPNLRLS